MQQELLLRAHRPERSKLGADAGFLRRRHARHAVLRGAAATGEGRYGDPHRKSELHREYAFEGASSAAGASTAGASPSDATAFVTAVAQQTLRSYESEGGCFECLNGLH